jgi:hypothetical protein
MAEDIVRKFWQEYIEADEFKRTKIIEKMQLFERLYPVMTSKDIDLKIKKHLFTSAIKSYFDDLTDMMMVDKI